MEMKKNILALLVSIGSLSIFSQVDAIYYDSYPSSVFPNISSSISGSIASMWYATQSAWSTVSSDSPQRFFYVDTYSSSDLEYYKSAVCILFSTISDSRIFFHDKINWPIGFALFQSGSQIWMDVWFSPSIEKVKLADFVSSTTTVSDNHPEHNVFCAVPSFIIKKNSLFWDGRYLYGVSTFHYYKDIVSANYYDYHTWIGTYGTQYSSDTNLATVYYPDGTLWFWRPVFNDYTLSSTWNNMRQSILEDYLQNLSSSKWLTITLPDYFNTTTLTGTLTDSGSLWNGTGSTVDYFAECTSFLDVWCYVKWLYNSVIAKIGEWIDSLFPNISFSGSFDSCGSGSTVSSSGTYMQRIANVIAIVNPLPPDDGDIICILWWSWQVDYHGLIPQENFFEHYISGVVPQLERSTRIVWDQTIFDIVVIVMITLAIFYKKHD